MKQREFTEDFKREAVRILTTSGRNISSVAEDLGIGKSTLERWRRNFAEKDLLSGPHEDMDQELARLRKENELLRQERDLLKKRRPSSLGRQVDEVCVHRHGEGPYVSVTAVRFRRRQHQRLLCMEASFAQSSSA
ncbi:hypothetical protein ADS42_016230 [Brucella melitensis]|nr:IS1953 family transposase OrfA [Brucella pinnipedialis B2/94]AQQ58536.1 hypothetical protein ADS42_016230 [Brucella melitensis]